MRIRLKKGMAARTWSGGPGAVLRVGDDIPAETAEALLNGGLAQVVREGAETASLETPEKAVRPRARRRKRTTR